MRSPQLKPLLVVATIFLTFFFPSHPAPASYNTEPACALSPDPGFCYAAFHKYFFNSTSATCESFIYGGCGGNANKFDDVETCEETCLN